MTPSDNPKDLARSNPAIAPETDETSNGEWPNVLLYGYASDPMDDVFRLYHGLGVTQFYEIPRRQIISVTPATESENPSLIQVLLPATSRITYVSSRKVTLPAGSVAAAVRAEGRAYATSPQDRCPTGCSYNGVCICTVVDHWLNLDPKTARELGVVDIDNPASS
jgi:hypothetical protein